MRYKALYGGLVLVVLTLAVFQPVTVKAKSTGLGWIRPGLHVAYVCVSGSLTISPWAGWRSSLSDEVSVYGGVGLGHHKIPVFKVGRSSALNIYEHYVVKSIDKKGVHLYYAVWANKRDVGAFSAEDAVVPPKEPFNGPFWVDPGLLRNAEQGSLIRIKWGDKEIPYAVKFEGRYDLSPFNQGSNGLAKIAPGMTIPLPKGTTRDVVALVAVMDAIVERNGQKQQKRVIHELVVDKETGLILEEAYMERSTEQQGPVQAVSRSLYARYLAEINMEMSGGYRLFREENPVIHAGYMVDANGMLSPGGTPSLNSIISTIVVAVMGVYKGHAVTYMQLFIGLDTPVTMAYIIDSNIRSGEEHVLEAVNPLTGQHVETVEGSGQGILYLPQNRLGSSRIEVYGASFVLVDTKNAEIEGLGQRKVYVYTTQDEHSLISLMAYIDTGKGGVLAVIQPGGVPGYQFHPVPGAPVSETPNTFPYMVEISELVASRIGNQASNAAGEQGGGTQNNNQVDIDQLINSLSQGEKDKESGNSSGGGSESTGQTAASGSQSVAITTGPPTWTMTSSNGGGKASAQPTHSATSVTMASGEQRGSQNEASRGSTASSVENNGGEDKLDKYVSIGLTLTVFLAIVIYEARLRARRGMASR
ncbi:hypothetical protein [Pyrofollis japonicus]|uniref:hypothetical protein n=1 Tax=Pyrofollis japonicus TaxID=3060460 RepID=UPI00295A8FDC|nr:hypothetical protein [Pyrofollis japonicus]